MPSDFETQTHFALEKGRRDSDRLVEDCFVGLVALLQDTFVQVDGKQYPIKVLAQKDKVMFDIRNLPGFDHIEFVITKTGWGRELSKTEGGK